MLWSKEPENSMVQISGSAVGKHATIMLPSATDTVARALLPFNVKCLWNSVTDKSIIVKPENKCQTKTQRAFCTDFS